MQWICCIDIHCILLIIIVTKVLQCGNSIWISIYWYWYLKYSNNMFNILVSFWYLEYFLIVCFFWIVSSKCIPKNVICVMRSILHISILTYRYINFWSVDFGLQYIDHFIMHYFSAILQIRPQSAIYRRFLRW